MVVASTVLAGFGGIVPVIIFMVVISKIVKAVKESASKAGKPAKPSTGGRTLESDLEKFFESLANQNSSIEQAPPPPPVPVAARAVARNRPGVKEKPPTPPKAARAPIRMASKPVKTGPAWGSEDYGIDIAVPNRARCTYEAKHAREELVEMLKDDSSIQKAVLLREILGPPVSMRM